MKHECFKASRVKIEMMRIKLSARCLFVALFVLAAPRLANALDLDIDTGKLPVIEMTPTHAPEVPPPTNRKSPARIKVSIETREVKGRLADGVEYTFWTFGGTVPGPMIRVRQGDYVDFTLKNHPSSKMPHNIDLHAVTGQGGGAEGSFTTPGHSSTFSFRALNPGLFIYHCATAPVGMHIANGMYGMILVEPEAGFPKVDREFYVVQSEFYPKGKNGAKGYQPFAMEKAIREQPEYVVFNGSVGAMIGEKAIKAKVGETVRIFFGNGGPNLVSSFHVIGEIFDKVYGEGGVKVSQEQVQTTLVPAGGSAIVEFTVNVPSTLILVDHSIFRAFNKGALGMLKVEGPANAKIYSGKTVDAIYQPEGGAIQSIANAAAPPKAASTFDERFVAGKSVFLNVCAACHQTNGEGIPGAFPPLVKSDFLLANRSRAIGAIKNGLSGVIKVNGKSFDGVMPALGLPDEDIANVLTYISNSWGNKAKMFTSDEVKRVK
jgi:nitrite reductase (NO-forming)